MRQRIEVNASVPGSGYKLKIMAVHQLDDQLVVVSKIKGGYGFATPDQQSLSDSVVVTTDHDSKLPLIHLLVDANKKQTGRHMSEYFSHNVSKSATVFEAADDEAALEEIMATGKCLYRSRADGMSGLRLARINKAVKPVVQLIHDNHDLSIKEGDTPGILNIHSVVDDGVVKIVFETILPKSKNDHAFNLKYLFQHALEKIGKNAISLEDDLLMSIDDDLYFDVELGGVKTKYITGAYEFTIPTNNPQLLLDFMLVTDFLTAEARKQSLQSHHYPFQFIQVSQQSVLTCFEDIFISTHRDDQSTIKKHCIEYPEPVVLEDFLNRLGVVHNPASVADVLLADLCSNENMPEYADLREFLVNYYQPFGLDIFKNPAKFFEQAFNLSVSKLVGDTTDLDEKLSITDALETVLMDSKKLSELSYFVKEFNAGAIEELLKPAYGYRAHNGKPYKESFTEFAFLRDAKFRMRTDGRMSIQPHESSGYDRYYGENARLHSLFAPEMMHLANILELEIAEDTDFEKEIIFTEDSTLKLKALGLHINEHNLRTQIANRVQGDFTGSLFSFFAAKQSMDEIQNKPSRVCGCVPEWCTIL